MTGDKECVTQHKLLVCQINLRTETRKQHKPPLKRLIWNLWKPKVQEKYKKAVEVSIDSDSEADVQSIRTEIKSCLINACDSVSGWMKENSKQRETWWWDETVESLVKQKIKLWKEWQKGGSKEKYLEAKRKAQLDIYNAKRKAQEEKI